MISDTPGRGGEGGVKKGQIFADVLYGWPLKSNLVSYVLLLLPNFREREYPMRIETNMCRFVRNSEMN